MKQRKALNLLLLAASSSSLFAEVVEVTLDAPDFDRWMYPYNASPGSRELASTFSSVDSGFDIFDDRDGQAFLGFITQNDVASGLGHDAYDITSATIYITISGDQLQYDPTVDAWDTYLEGVVEDSDSGRPFELFGAAFRNEYTGWSFGETGPFPFGAVRGERNVYPITFTDSGDAIDASNNVLEEFTPMPFATGRTDLVQPGQFMPSETVLSFDVDVSDPDIQCYLRSSVNDGLLSVVLTSLHFASQPGLKQLGGLSYPNFHMKESLAVVLGLVDAARCDLTVVVAEQVSIPEDIDGDGSVSVTDLLVLIGDWGDCNCCSSDINIDGEVNVIDLLAVIAAWS